MLVAYGTSAQAALQAVGPISAANTLPTWYQDTASVALMPCLDANGMCVLPPTPPTPYTTTGPISDLNFPSEIFYFIADSSVGVAGGGTASLRLALEAAFLGGVTPNTGITFLRINFKVQKGTLAPNSTYTVTHPYGTFTFATDGTGTPLGTGGVTFRSEDVSAGPADGYFPAGMQAATNTHIGPWLKSSAGLVTVTDPVTGATTQYLGSPTVPTTVTGSPLATNFFRIDGPGIGGVGVNRVQTNQFTVSGKLAPPPGTPITINSATYSRSATAGQVTVFATSLPTANLTVSGAGFATTPMLHDPVTPGNFFLTIPATPALLPGVPAQVSVVNTQDALLTPVPPPHTHALVDGVSVSVANYDPLTHVLTVKAASSDTLAPLPVLTVPTIVPTPPATTTTLDANGLLKATVAIPPANVTVNSSKGGAATVPVTLGALPVPVAVNDTASTPAGVPVTINVAANDTPLGSILSVTPGAVTPATAGTVAAAGTSVTFTPAAGFNGLASFTYTATDNLGQVSAPATVSVTVNLTTVTTIPNAVADSATTAAGTAVTIPVLANDTVAAPGILSPASVAIVTGSALGGTPVVNPTGTVTFTPAAGFSGPASFSYTVKNTAGQVSNAATVSITVSALVGPTAVADVATTAVNTPRVINVLANDTGLPLASTVTIVTPPTLGTAVVNLDGTITYASATAGSTTFTYNVKNAAGGLSNTATVSVSVTSAVTDAVTILRAQFNRTTKEWLVEGTTTNVAPVSKTVTLYVGNAINALKILGTVNTNASDGRWKFQLPGNAGNIAPDATNTISAALPSGASRLGFPVAVK
jgi:hypothetical protein